MKVYAKLSPIEEISYEPIFCAVHGDRLAKYKVEAVVFNQTTSKNFCESCICSHFNIQVFFSVQEGMTLPKGLIHNV